jgi:hypothetical protein
MLAGGAILSKYISGLEILEKYRMKPIELFALIVGESLQPYDQFGEPIPPPDVDYYRKEISQYKRQLSHANHDLGLSDKEQKNDLQGIDSNMLRMIVRRHTTNLTGEERESPEAEHRRHLQAIEKMRDRRPPELVAKMLADEATEKLSLLKAKVALCGKRNPKKDLFSWLNFNFKSIPTDILIRSGHNKARTVILDQIAGSETLYFQAEVERIKSDKKKKAKLRPDQKHKLLVRTVAEAIWKEDPEITITEMVRRDEINLVCEGKSYTDKTIRKWIADLCPNRNPGRRKTNKTPPSCNKKPPFTQK